jgi:hypothetical protein
MHAGDSGDAEGRSQARNFYSWTSVLSFSVGAHHHLRSFSQVANEVLAPFGEGKMQKIIVAFSILFFSVVTPAYASSSTFAAALPCPQHGNIQQCINEELAVISQKLDAVLRRLPVTESSNARMDVTNPINDSTPETTAYFDNACAQYAGTLMSFNEESADKDEMDSWKTICERNPNHNICATTKNMIAGTRGVSSLACRQ